GVEIAVGGGGGAGRRSTTGLPGGRVIFGITISHCAVAAELASPQITGAGATGGTTGAAETSVMTGAAEARLADGLMGNTGAASAGALSRYVKVTGKRNQAMYSTSFPESGGGGVAPSPNRAIADFTLTTIYWASADHRPAYGSIRVRWTQSK